MTPNEVIDNLRLLQQERRWDELKRAGVEALAVVSTGEDIALVRLMLGEATFHTIRYVDDWQVALDHTKKALAVAPSSSLLRVVALQRLSSLCVDLGRYDEAQAYADAFLAESYIHGDALKPYTAFVVRDLSHVEYRRRHYSNAVALRRRALALFDSIGNTLEVERTAVNLAWAYLRASRIDDARQVLPMSDDPTIRALTTGALCAILVAERRFEEAVVVGRESLGGERKSFDLADAAEVALSMTVASHQLGKHLEALTYLRVAIDFAVRQGRDALVHRVAVLLGQRGGDATEYEAYRGNLRLAYRACYAGNTIA